MNNHHVPIFSLAPLCLLGLLGRSEWPLRGVQERSAALQPSDAWIVANRMDQLPEFFCKATQWELVSQGRAQ